VTRGAKLGGGALVLAVVCLGAWYMASSRGYLELISPRLPRIFRKILAAKPASSPRMAHLPNLYLWAWERPEDLQFLGNGKVGVAFLAKTISAVEPKASSEEATAEKPDANFVRPRLQPLRIEPGTHLMAVVRIEASRGAASASYGPGENSSARISVTQISAMANEIAITANIPGVSAVQIDFDATSSEHDFYRALLLEVRKRLPGKMPLSITALASWCIGDRWLEQLPAGTIDEAVPMLFRMGQGSAEVTHYLSSGKDFTVPACMTSLGLSTDETLSRGILSGKIVMGRQHRAALRVYVFSPSTWKKAQAEELVKGVQTWHVN
jgi:hypothetical protein